MHFRQRRHLQRPPYRDSENPDDILNDCNRGPRSSVFNTLISFRSPTGKSEHSLNTLSRPERTTLQATFDEEVFGDPVRNMRDVIEEEKRESINANISLPDR